MFNVWFLKYCVEFICLSSLKLFLFRFFIRGRLNAFTCPQLTGRTHISFTRPLFIPLSSSLNSSWLWLPHSLLLYLPSVCQAIYMTRNSGNSGRICFQIDAFDALFQFKWIQIITISFVIVRIDCCECEAERHAKKPDEGKTNYIACLQESISSKCSPLWTD